MHEIEYILCMPKVVKNVLMTFVIINRDLDNKFVCAYQGSVI